MTHVADIQAVMAGSLTAPAQADLRSVVKTTACHFLCSGDSADLSGSLMTFDKGVALGPFAYKHFMWRH